MSTVPAGSLLPRRARLIVPAAFAAAAGLVALLVGGLGWPREQAFMAAILLLAGTLWVTEAVPLFATSILVITAELLLLANPGRWPGLGFADGATGPTFRELLGAAADPILVLFFAGFVLARAAAKEGVDQAMASWLLRPFTHSRPRLLFGLMGVTFLFGMWMSNTATAAFMLTLTMPLLAQFAPADPFRKALLLAVPFAAGIGGLGTPIASPPNALAVGYLAREGHRIGFLEWMIIALPLSVIMIALAGTLLLRQYRGPVAAQAESFHLPPVRLTGRARGVVAIFTATVLLWVTEGLHGLSAPMVALLPVVSLLFFGFIDRADVNRLDWDVLLLIGGGLTLGFGLEATGLDERLARLLPAGGSPWLLAALVLATFGLGIFLSNTAVANLMLPIGLSAARAEGLAVPMVLAITFMCSLSMVLPISTPPNALAYARGEFTAAEMARIGLRLGLAGAALLIAGGLLWG